MEPLNLILIMIGGLMTVCIFAIFERYWRSLIESFFRMLMSPIVVAEGSLNKFWAGVRNFYRHQFEDKAGNLNLQTIFYEFIGSLLYTASFGLFIYADFHIMCLTLAGMGLESSHFIPPIGAGSLTVLSLIAGVLFFGALFLDLMGMTKISPWRERLSSMWEKIIFYLCLISLFLLVTVSLLCGLWRGKSLSEADINLQVQNQTTVGLSGGGLSGLDNATPPQMALNTGIDEKPKTDWIPIIINMAIPAVFLIGGTLSGWGVIELFKFLVLLIFFIILCPTGLSLILMSYTSRIIERFYEVILSVFNLGSAIGRWLLEFLNYRPPYGQSGHTPTDNPDARKDCSAGSNHTASTADDKTDENESSNTKEDWNPYNR